jgi:hypothetical protein
MDEEKQSPPWIRLYVPSGWDSPRVTPGSFTRPWFTAGMYHCLPLTMAGQLGWTVHNPSAIAAVWNGGPNADDLKVANPSQDNHATSHFGHGIITFNPGFYVRTSPEIDILVKGVPNHVKDGISPLEGLIETDWFDGSFTVNVRLTRPGLVVTWDVNEPLFQIVPYPRGWLEQFRTETCTEGDEHTAFFAKANPWDDARVASVERGRTGEKQGWDGKYRKGRELNGTAAPSSHQTYMRVSPFPGLSNRESGPTNNGTTPDGRDVNDRAAPIAGE